MTTDTSISQVEIPPSNVEAALGSPLQLEGAPETQSSVEVPYLQAARRRRSGGLPFLRRAMPAD